MVELTNDRVRTAARAYVENEPFVVVEAERLDTLPEAFATGEYGWKDCEWVVRWYARRPLDGGVHPAEERFRENAFDDCRAAISRASEGDALGDPLDSLDDRLDALTALAGVDVPIASALLHYVNPDEFLALSPREWRVLEGARELVGTYPDQPASEDYETYLRRCRAVAADCDVDLLTLSRALWRLGETR